VEKKTTCDRQGKLQGEKERHSSITKPMRDQWRRDSKNKQRKKRRRNMFQNKTESEKHVTGTQRGRQGWCII
jgi:hypothetical protein